MATYNFDHWVIDGSVAGTDPVLSLVVNKNLSIIAVYAISVQKWTVTVDSSPVSVMMTSPARTVPFQLTDIVDGSTITLVAPATVQV